MDYTTLELRALAHMAIGYGPRMKSVSVDREAMRELSRRQAVYHGHEWDPITPPLRMGPQRCLSSRETIERLAFVLPKPRPALTPKEIGEYLSAWWSKYPAAREYFPERAKPRTVWMGGDYTDDGTHKATPEEATERWRWLREVIVEAGKRHPTDPEAARLLREETLYGAQTYYPPHTRDTKPRG